VVSLGEGLMEEMPQNLTPKYVEDMAI